jgi:2,3-dimethylmalate lyase
MSGDGIDSTARPGALSWRAALAAQRPLLLPIAHDALSAMLIEQAGFKAYAVGGFSVVGARLGLPDLGLASVSEMADAVREMMAACRLPVLVDADDGYGDVKNVVRTICTYERMGVACVQLEDQMSPKRCGHMAGKAVIPVEDMIGKIRAAVLARENRETFLLARTDARAIEGLDSALRRGEQYVAAGADGLFIEAPLSPRELEVIGRTFDVPLLANMLEGGQTPMMTSGELFDLGFSMIGYPTSLLFRIVKTMQRALGQLAQGMPSKGDDVASFDEFRTLIGLSRWGEIEDRLRSRKPPLP